MNSVSQIIIAISNEIINPLILLLFGLALVLFLWGAFRFIASADSDEGRETGKRHLTYGIIGMVIMVSVYGILRVVTGAFGVDLPSY
jgi:hypothetical protein